MFTTCSDKNTESAFDALMCMKSLQCTVVALLCLIDVRLKLSISIVLMDIALQGEMDGIETAKIIHDELGISTATLRRWLRRAGYGPKNDSYGSNPKSEKEKQEREKVGVDRK